MSERPLQQNTMHSNHEGGSWVGFEGAFRRGFGSLAQRRVNVYHPLPDHYQGDLLSPKVMLEELCNQTVFSKLETTQGRLELVRAAYGVVRNIGDQWINKQDGEAGKVLAHVAPPQFVDWQEDEKGLGNDGMVVVPGPQDNIHQPARYSLDIEKLKNPQECESFVEWLRYKQVEMSPGGVGFWLVLRAAAHEAAHVIQAGLGELAGDAGPERVNFLSRLVSENGAKSDPRVENEKFAEGYAMIVLRSALQTAGYKGEQLSAIMWAMSYEGDTEAISLGYDPLPPGQVVNQLRLASQHIRQARSFGD